MSTDPRASSVSRRHRVACVQTHPVFGEVAANLAAVDGILEGVEADLLVLPELFATGYSFRTRDEVLARAETVEAGGPTLERLRAWSRSIGGVVVGGFAEREGQRVYNSAAVAIGGEIQEVYRKVHLFGFEPEYFEAGTGAFPVVEHAGLQIGVMICFDWIFPEVARTLALAGADVIAHPSNLVLPWCQRAMPVRALENGVYTALANRVGEEERAPRPRLGFTGRSQIASPLGEVLAEAPVDGTTVIEAEVDPSVARDKSLPSGNDRLAERRPVLYRRLLDG